MSPLAPSAAARGMPVSASYPSLFGFAGDAWKYRKHEVLIVELHDREGERRADSEQQHTVGGLYRAQNLPVRQERDARGAPGGHRVEREEDRALRRPEGAKPQI